MKVALRITALLLLIGIGICIFIAATEPGLRLLLRSSQVFSDNRITVGEVRGTLLSSWQLMDIEVTTPAATISLKELSSSWQAGDLWQKNLHILELKGRNINIALADDGQESSKPITLQELALPFALIVDRVDLGDIHLQASDGTPLTTIDSLSFSLRTSATAIHLTDLQLAAPDYDLTFGAELNTSDQWHIDGMGQGSYMGAGGPVTGNMSVEGSLAELTAIVNLQQPGKGTLRMDLRDAVNNPGYNLGFSANGLDLATINQALPKTALDLQGFLTGDMAGYRGEISAHSLSQDLGPLGLQSSFAGDLQAIEIEQLSLTTNKGQAVMREGQISWQDGLIWQGKLSLNDFDPQLFLPEISGSLQGELTGKGSYKAGAVTADIEIIELSGQLREKELAAQGRLRLTEKHIAIEPFELSHGISKVAIRGTAISESGLADWRNSLDWQAKIDLQRFDPAMLLVDYPGDFNGVFVTSGSVSGGTLTGQAEIASLEGELRGYRLSGAGNVLLQSDRVQIDAFRLQSGDSTLQVDGEVAQQLDLVVMLSSPDLGQVLEGAKGEIALDGTVTGSRDLPQLEGNVSVLGLRYETLGIAQLQGRFSGGVETMSELFVEFSGQGLQLAEMHIDRGQLGLTGTARQHALSLNLSSGEENLSLAADGNLDDDFSWVGRVRDAVIDSPAAGNWRQQGQGLLNISGEKIVTESFCFTAAEEEICISGNFVTQDTSWQTFFTLKQVELSRLNGFGLLPEPISGTARAEVVASGDARSIDSLIADIEVVGGGLGTSEQQAGWQQFLLTRAELELQLIDEILKTEVTALFQDGSNLELTARIADFGDFNQDPATMPLQGQAIVDLRNLKFVAPLTRYTVLPAGSLQGTLALSGLLSRPIAEGALVLNNGSIDLPGWGISLTDARFQLIGTEGALEVSGTASSGPGTVQADGRLSYNSDGMVGDFRIIGENVDTLRLPEYEIQTSPDIRMQFTTDGGTLSGRLLVPYANLTPEEMSDSLEISDDVVYLDGAEPEAALGWYLTTSLQVELGEEVKLDGYGLNGYLHGELQVDSKPGSYMTGKGELSLEDGIFSVYGRKLDIERGKVLFSGGPIENPGIDVRARKVVADKSAGLEGIEVGVIAAGTLEDLEFKLFSNPAMDDSDILAYMVIGRSMSDTGEKEENLLTSVAGALGLEESAELVQGITSLLPVDDLYFEGTTSGDDMSVVFGKRITSDLYIGYDHNFFDQKGEVLMRYELGAGFSAETRTSADATSADLLYSFER